MTRAVAIAHSNIALSKYWGKLDTGRNLAAVPSLSMTLEALSTRTAIELAPALELDEVTLDGKPAEGRALSRVVSLLDRVRARAGVATRARVESANSFPTAAGLASSASGFAALSMAATAAFGLDCSPADLSALSRESSVSAARSIFGGFVELGKGAESAERLAPADALPVGMVIALTVAGPKSVGSTEGMLHTAATSPYYAAWVTHAPELYARARAAILSGDLATLGDAMEQSALMMHASMFAARPALIYFAPATLAVVERVRSLRAQGIPAFFTMDAGPHVKVLTRTEHLAAVAEALSAVAGVHRVITTGVGPDAHLVPGDVA